MFAVAAASLKCTVVGLAAFPVNEIEALADQLIHSRLDSQNEYDIESTPSFAIGNKFITGVPSEEKLAELIAAAAK